MTLASGTKLGRYEIRSKIGEGGMGEVYLAVDTSELGRTVAIKLLSAEVAANPKRMQRFVQEAKTVSALNHPSILTIYEFGQEGATRFIATEFVDGETLRQHMLKRLKLHEVLDIAMQVAAALDAAHEANVIHRDIKPENVMVRRRDHIVKVLDFGLAKAIEPNTAESPPTDPEAGTKLMIHTEPGVVMGTVAYMSPEQSLGSSQVDHRTDLWSLGAVTYELLAGRVPFEGKDVHRQIIAIQETNPAPLARFVDGVPERLEEIVGKTLAKNPNERYQTAKDLLIDLRNLKRKLDVDAEIDRTITPEIRGAGSTASDPATPSTVSGAAAAQATAAQSASSAASSASSAEYLIDGIRRHKLGVWLAGLILAIAISGLAYYQHARNTEVAIESIAVLPFINQSGDPNAEYLSDGLTESIINSLSRLPKLSVKARSTVFRYKGKDIEPQQVGSELNVQAVLNGRVVQRGDDLTLSLELVDARTGNEIWGEQYNRKVTDLVALQNEITRDVSQKLRMRLSGADAQKLTKNYTQNAEAYQAYLKGLYYWNKGPAPGYEKSRDYFQQAIDLDPSYALAYSGLALYYSFAAANGLLPPDENWPKAEAAANKALALDETLAESYNPLAAIKLYYYRDWPAAERYFRRGIELDPNFAEIHNHYALCLYLFGRNEEALTELQRAVELEPLSLRFSLQRARILFFIRQYDRAIDQFRKTLELEPNFALAHEGLGDAYEQKGMQREAIAEWAKALTLSGEGEQASILERAYAASGFETAVRALAQKKLERLNEKAGRGEYVPASEYVMAYLRLGDKEKLFGWLAKAVEERNRLALDFKVNPIFDSLRSDPRFADLVRRVGL